MKKSKTIVLIFGCFLMFFMGSHFILTNLIIADKVNANSDIEIEIISTSNKSAIVKITNTSDKIIYVPFLSGGDGDWATLGCEGLQKYDPINKTYSTFNCSIAGLGYYPLNEGKALIHLIKVAEKGTYRTNFPYFQDKLFVEEKINKFHELSEYEKNLTKDSIDKLSKKGISINFDM